MKKRLDESVLETHIVIQGFEGTLSQLFVELALGVWNDEGFSGKRPFGDSGWHFDVFACLIEAGVLEGKLDRYGFIEEVDDKEATRLITELVVEYMS